MNPAIRVTGLGKRYRLGLTHARTLNEVAARWSRRLRGRAADDDVIGEDRKDYPGSDFWALRDVDFEIQPGEVVGLIGRNGAGKSTLLKLLSRVTRPTAGSIEMRGRVGSLLEVGTGFHPELTGRENVFMNGTLLGMTKQEVERRFDDIVEFAGVEAFIDTPVKRYSSGMKVRLGFAVAAHLEPEILIVDEVLAVGDAAFQERCLEAIKNITTSGRTVFLVSHQMGSVKALCTVGIVLDRGRLDLITTDIGAAISRYSHSHRRVESVSWARDPQAPTSFAHPAFTPHRFSLQDRHGRTIDSISESDTEVWVHIEGFVQESDPNLSIGYSLSRSAGPLLYWSYYGDGDKPARLRGNVTLRSRLPAEWLNAGKYQIELVGGIHCQKWLFSPGESSIALGLEVSPSFHSTRPWYPVRPTPLAPLCPWDVLAGGNTPC